MNPTEARTAIQRISDNEHQALVLLDENAQLLDRLVAWLDAVTDPPAGLRLVIADGDTS